MDNDDLYDEFGNFVGDPFDSDAESIVESEKSQQEESVPEPKDEYVQETALVKSNSLSQRFKEVDTIVVDPAQQAGDEPVIKPVVEKKLHIEFKKTEEQDDLPAVVYSREYMKQLAKDLPERIRNVAVVGGLHTGKTSLIDTLVLETHPDVTSSKQNQQDFKPMRYLDTHKLERSRGISINSTPMTLMVPDTKERSHVLNILDCPGHPDFEDEILALLLVSDGAILVLDALEGLTKRDKRLISTLVKHNLPIVVVLNKFDRLILELRLPVKDFYHKIKYILDDVNACIHHSEFAETYSHNQLISPLMNNVIFASTSLLAHITLKTFSNLYANKLESMKGVDAQKFEKLLWGEVFFDSQTGQFTKNNNDGTLTRTFEQFVLEPIYKLVSYTLTTDPKGSKLSQLLWDNFGVSLHKSQYKQDPQVLLRDVFSAVFEGTREFVDLIVSTIPNPTVLVAETLTKRGLVIEDAQETETVAEIFKMTMSADAKTSHALVRVYKGALKVGSRVKIVGDNYLHDRDDYKTEEIEELFIPGGRYKVPTDEVTAGNFAIVAGIGSTVGKQASVFNSTFPEHLLHPIHRTDIGQRSVYKVAVEPEHPSELPKLVEGLRKLSTCYLSSVTKLEESGEHVVLAPGELYLDCFLHDLRHIFEDYLSIKVSDPMTKFGETCSGRSVTKITTFTPSKKAQISITSEPVNDRKLSRAIEVGKINLAQPQRTTAKILRDEFGWDSLAARSIWCFGPEDMQNPSILLDDTIEGDTDKQALLLVKDLVRTGFKLGVNEGPLCDEPIRSCKFKILDAVLSGSGIHTSGSQIIPMTRNAVHTGFLTASPRLLEPMYRVNVVCTYKSIEAVQTILGKRRGWTVSEVPVPATQLYEVEGYVPVTDSIGLDTDMRLQTQGQAMCFLEFARWDVVPGDPLDKDCFLPPMRPVPRASLARDFVMKTRRRKGLSGEPNLQKYLDPELYHRLKESGIVN